MEAYRVFLSHEKLKSHIDKHCVFGCMDNPGVQFFRLAVRIRCGYVGKFNQPHPTIPDQIEAIWPIIGPLHISLNMRETLFGQHDGLLRLVHRLIVSRELPKKPTPQQIDYLVTAIACAWRNGVREHVARCIRDAPPKIKRDPHVHYLWAVLDDEIQTVYSVYEEAHRGGFFGPFFSMVLRLAEYALRWGRWNYRYRLLELVADIAYLKKARHLMADVIEKELAAVSDYPIENMHSQFQRLMHVSDSPDAVKKRAEQKVVGKQLDIQGAVAAKAGKHTYRLKQEDRYRVAVASARVALLTLFERVLSPDGMDGNGMPLEPLPAAPPVKESGKEKRKRARGGAGRGKRAATKEKMGSGGKVKACFLQFCSLTLCVTHHFHVHTTTLRCGKTLQCQNVLEWITIDGMI